MKYYFIIIMMIFITSSYTNVSANENEPNLVIQSAIEGDEVLTSNWRCMNVKLDIYNRSPFYTTFNVKVDFNECSIICFSPAATVNNSIDTINIGGYENIHIEYELVYNGTMEDGKVITIDNRISWIENWYDEDRSIDLGGYNNIRSYVHFTCSNPPPEIPPEPPVEEYTYSYNLINTSDCIMQENAVCGAGEITNTFECVRNDGFIVSSLFCDGNNTNKETCLIECEVESPKYRTFNCIDVIDFDPDGTIVGECVPYTRAKAGLNWNDFHGSAWTVFQQMKDAGFATGHIAAKGAIIVFDIDEEREMYWGHIGELIDINGNIFTIADSNFKEKHKAYIHDLDITGFKILGYVYCDGVIPTQELGGVIYPNVTVVDGEIVEPEDIEIAEPEDTEIETIEPEETSTIGNLVQETGGKDDDSSNCFIKTL